jgi:LPS-assembly lipoprotein
VLTYPSISGKIKLMQSSASSIIAHRPSLIVMLTAALLLSACGFQLRGTGQLPFKTIYLQTSSTSPFGLQLKRAIESGTSTRVTESPGEAEVVLQILSEVQEKKILSLTGGGRVNEFLLRYRVSFRLTDKLNREHIPTSEIVLRQAVTFNDQQVLSKEHEEAGLYRNMRSDAVQQLLRRLQATKLKS